MKKLLSFALIAVLVLSNFNFVSAKTSNESLDDLYVSKTQSSSSSKKFEMCPEFDTEVLDYYVFLPDGIDECYIYAEPEDNDYTVYCEDDEIKERNDYYYLLENISDGDEVDIQVDDEDDDKLDVYTITFILGDDDDDDNADLESLSVKNKTDASTYKEVDLDKKFDEDTTEYSVTVDSNAYSTIQIYAESDDNGAHVFINGEYLDGEEYDSFPISSGTNKFTITVVAENCDDIKTYTLNVKTGAVTSSISTLSSMIIRDAAGNIIYASPAFSTNQLNYTTNVPNDIASVSLYAKTTAADATVNLNGATLTNGGWSEYKTLNEGMNTFTVKSIASDSSATTYSLCIYRQAKQLETLVSIQKLTVNNMSKTMNAYNINGNNFIKIRDIASLLNGTAKQFNVGYNELTNNVILTYGTAYISNGQENQPLGVAKEVMVSEQIMYVGTTPVNVMTYNIDGNNYVMLRDIALLFDFGVGYNLATDTIAINTGSKYSPQ